MSVLSRSNPAVAPSFQASVAAVPARSQARVRFGPFELDPKAGELRIGETKVVLQEQPYNILLMLIEHSGDVLTRDEIQKRLWPDVIVDFEHGINQAIRKLRCVLNDSADDPKYIETVGRRGYRLLVPVEVVEGPLEPERLIRDTVSDNRLLQLIRGGKGMVNRAEDLKAIAAALAKLLQILADLEPRPTTRQRRGRCFLNTRSLLYQR
jgi:DNA-binding winged helix-turn-helix (wHTH) protein